MKRVSLEFATPAERAAYVQACRDQSAAAARPETAADLAPAPVPAPVPEPEPVPDPVLVPGDVVQLKSGGPAMVVAGKLFDTIDVLWLVSETVQRDCLPRACLRRLAPAPLTPAGRP